MKKKIRVGVAGATGYAGQELLKILLGHSHADITVVARHSTDKDELISDIFPEFKGRIDKPCVGIDPEAIAGKTDLVFLALPHKASMSVVPHLLAAGKKVVDLSADYRLDAKVYEKWYGVAHKDTGNLKKAVYGLPELNFPAIKKSGFIANPGCYPTSAILALAPAIKTGMIRADTIIIDAKSGVTGAGRKADLSIAYSEVNENLKAYKVNEHQHQPEIDQALSAVAKRDIAITFVPHLIPMNRGILSTIYVTMMEVLTAEDVIGCYKAFYKGKPFVRIHDAGHFPEVRNVVNTNYCDIGFKVTGTTLIIVSCIDNLTKGAAGQAVQNMNIMCGFEETEGLL